MYVVFGLFLGAHKFSYTSTSYHFQNELLHLYDAGYKILYPPLHHISTTVLNHHFYLQLIAKQFLKFNFLSLSCICLIFILVSHKNMISGLCIWSHGTLSHSPDPQCSNLTLSWLSVGLATSSHR